jgi:hypothetical protein
MCELVTGYDKICDLAGGVDTWYIFATKDSSGNSNIDTLTVANGEVTDLTLASGKYAHPFNVEIETSSFTDIAVGDRPNGSYAREQSATILLHGNTASMIEMIEDMCKGRVTVIAKLNDGTYEVLFLNNGGKASDERATGTAFEDMNGNTLTITGKETSKAPKIDSAIVSALLPPTS